jgi:hypothetical protein
MNQHKDLDSFVVIQDSDASLTVTASKVATAAAAAAVAATSTSVTDADPLASYHHARQNVTPASLFTARQGDQTFAFSLVTPRNIAVYHCGEAVYRCRTCGDRLREFARMVTASGAPFQFSADANVDQHFMKLATDIAHIQGPPTTSGLEIMIHYGDKLCDYDPQSGTNTDLGVPFYHWTVPIDPSTRTTISRTDGALIEQAVHRYILGDRFIQRQVEELLSVGIETRRADLKLMSEIMKKATYGDKMLGSIRLAEKVLDYMAALDRPFSSFSPMEQIVHCVQFLVFSPIHRELYSAVATLWHQISGNLLDLLKTANDEKAMLAMLEERFSPNNYQRRTADPSAGAVQIAMDQLGEFTNTVMTKDQLETHPAVVTIKPRVASSMSAFDKMLEQGTKPKSFSQRCAPGDADSAAEIQAIKTIADLVAFLRAHPTTKVEVKADGITPIYIASTTLAADRLKVPHIWSFMNSHAYASSMGWQEVTHILPMYEYITGHCNVFFRMASSPPYKITGNCCFPEFLEPAYSRTCGAAFERLNTTMPITVPSGEIAYGVGESGKNRDFDLNRTLSFRLTGKEITISRMK